MTDDEISEGTATGASPFQRVARATRTFSTVEQPNHIETVIAEVDVEGEQHLVKLSRYHDNQQFWTVPGERDERLRGRKTVTVTEPEPDEYELYDITVDPYEERNLAHPTHADDRSRALQATMLGLLGEQLAAKRLVPSRGRGPRLPPSRERLRRAQGDTRCGANPRLAPAAVKLTWFSLKSCRPARACRSGSMPIQSPKASFRWLPVA